MTPVIGVGIVGAAVLFAVKGLAAATPDGSIAPSFPLDYSTTVDTPPIIDYSSDMNKILPAPGYWGTPYDSIIIESAQGAGIEPGVLYNLLNAESHFRSDIITGAVKSKTGALGIAQFMPETAIEELGSVAAALDPSLAIPGAARYLAKLIANTGSVVSGVAAYNWGIGNVQRKGLSHAPAETVAYVKNITGENIA